MNVILQQLGLNQTFFIQFGIILAVFVVVSNVLFKPAGNLIRLRHKKMVEDREAAERLVKEANEKLEEYKARLSEERTKARAEYEAVLSQAKKEETEILNQARGEAKRLTQEAIDSIAAQKDKVARQLEVDVESMAQAVANSIASSKREG